jgi:phosphoglycerate dehydrogenase-like enzyme
MRERTPLPAGILSRLPRLRLVVTTGMTNAAIDLNAGVMVCGTQSLTSPTVEMTWALITGLCRNLCAESQSLRAGSWQSGVGEGLEGQTLGLLGLGRIGSRMAGVGQAFGMHVTAWSQNLTQDAAAGHGVEWVSREDLFRQADILSIHLRLSPRTRGLVDGNLLRSMKPTARLVNTSRAGIVDQQALLEALHHGWIAGAGLDVFDHEPVPADHPLLDAPNTLLTPHLGYVVRQNYELFFAGALEAIHAYLDGQPIRVISPG